MSTSRSSVLPDRFLDPDRIRIARARRGFTKADLARLLGVTPRTITRYESGDAPRESVDALARLLEFPASFFTAANAPEIEVASVSFRAARRATARSRNAAVAAGAIGIEVDRWISQRFVLPTVDVPAHPEMDPRLAARLVRAQWGLGTRPLPNAVQLAESRGVRVYTLPPIAEEVDAYSAWHTARPYIFLSRRRSPERMRFDVAHELGHLVLHPAAACDDAAQEREADAFASEFLVPLDAIPEYLRSNPSLAELLRVRDQFKVSAMALAYATHAAGRMTDWAYRNTCIELSARGFRSSEPGGMAAHEMSRVFPQILGSPSNVFARHIAADLHVPVEEVRALTFGVELGCATPATDVPAAQATADVGYQRLQVVR
ncbi:XRE family transcriptional regulator [Mycobacterium sp. 29Ha]|uniref:XRE family transcriptional regulator n=1 Tax=Mycobacterium sp. 29Ha TaxID=2939268 RepID=UPI002938DEC2|nr:XRE family transcriptional regulator [Mycobacterium sp. 29Ha]MDV3131447.1 XRE family transcriptional regulator [Mycobacterium sp. 29Ha]